MQRNACWLHGGRVPSDVPSLRVCVCVSVLFFLPTLFL